VTTRDYAQAIIKNGGVTTSTLRISVDSSIMMPIVGDLRICSFIQVRRTCARFIRSSLASLPTCCWKLKGVASMGDRDDILQMIVCLRDGKEAGLLSN
jgi:hypothetical protein